MILSPGDIVYSTCGHDSGKVFAVLSVDGVYAYICDGRTRKTEKPKKKKIKHLKTGVGHSDVIAQRINEGKILTNPAVREELKPYK